MNAVYQVAGVSKQAYHQHVRKENLEQEKLHELILQVDLLRKEHPGCGLEKVYYSLLPDWLGRDRFIDVFMELGYRVQKVRNFRRTTIPVHVKCPNLIEGLLVWDKNRIWQSDITYFEVSGRFYYLVFIIDIYTKQVKGYQVSDHMRAEANVAALKMAFKSASAELKGMIHHSDRGSQYVDKKYQKELTNKGIMISMGMKAQDNAYAERINGIIKNEYLNYRDIISFHQLKTETKKAVHHYNHKRIHRNLPGRISPVAFEKKLLNLSPQNRPKVIVYAEGNFKFREVSNLPEFTPETEPQVHVCPMVNNM